MLEKSCKGSWRYKDKWGYYKIERHWKGDYYQLLHRFVYAKHHNLKLKPTDIIRHLCNNPSCVEITHLAKGTLKDNTADSIKAGTHPSCFKTGAIITYNDAEEIRRLYKETSLTQQKIADRFGISQSQVSGIIAEKSWKSD